MESSILLTLLWAESTVLSLLMWLIFLLGVLYLARKRAQTLIQTTCRLLARQLRQFARRLIAAGTFVRRRNRSYLLALARNQAKRSLDREFRRVALGVERELATFPSLSRRLGEQITRVEQDYRESVPPSPRPPEWLEAVSTLTHSPGRNDPAVQRILEDLTNTLDRAAHQALLEYRTAQHRRHRLLARMQPYWRMVERRLGSLEATIAELNRRSRRIDRAMLRLQSQHAESPIKKIANAASVRFLSAIALLTAVVPVAVVAFQLIARPLAEITNGTDAVIGIPFYNVTAAAMLLTEITAGALVLESMAVTHLLPAVAALEPHIRNRLRVAASTAFLLTVSATVALAWTRDYLIHQDIALVELLQAGQASFPGPEFHWIPALTHSALALGLGFLLGVVAIPLQSVLQSGRFVLGSALALSLTAAGEFCHLGAVLSLGMGRFLNQAYDLLIFMPLRLESWWLHVWHNRMTGDTSYFDKEAEGKARGTLSKRQVQQ
ncbi:hypothetical protein [Nitrococcus mobilis]|uniref:Uncharacterized protein n=1 Tax=Nitrococcus mobilis Nb-231 TaxID=314278 RepID=A4BS59_9GAMM|nr:hypothetical protein [Nitrococcus mobilis]EAR21538.1 hypothetical protein NB231_01469 [Nitrococcus mobilis Nb-231]